MVPASLPIPQHPVPSLRRRPDGKSSYLTTAHSGGGKAGQGAPDRRSPGDTRASLSTCTGAQPAALCSSLAHSGCGGAPCHWSRSSGFLWESSLPLKSGQDLRLGPEPGVRCSAHNYRSYAWKHHSCGL